MRKETIRIFATMAIISLFASALWAGGKHTRFEVISTIPTQGARGVPIDMVLTAAFNQELDCSTLTTSTFTLKEDWVGGGSEGWLPPKLHGAVAGTVICSGTWAAFTPESDLEPNTNYTARIADWVKDVNGQRLEFRFEWCFRTGSTPTPPWVTAVTPLNKATGVALNTKITAAFDQAMKAATIDASTFELTGPGATSVSGVITYDTTNNIATFAPASNLAPLTLFTATITTGVQNLSGTAMPFNYVWTFETGATKDVTPPTVISTNPLSGATGVPLNQIITATFSKTMNPSTITTTTFTLMQGVTPVSGAVTYAAIGTMATFVPTANLAASTLYTATIKTGVTDLAGNQLASNYVWTFTTGTVKDTTAPTVVSTNPANNATGVCINGAINATFSKPMDPATINTATFTVTGPASAPVIGTVSLDVAGTIATFTPASSLATGTSYTATITTGVTDLAGNPLGSANVWMFTTGTKACIAPVALGAMAPFGAFGGGAGMTNTGINTVINGDIGTTGASTKLTGFHDHLIPYAPPSGCIYTETTLDVGNVTGLIYTAAPPPTVSCPNEGTAATSAIAAAAAADALTAYNNTSPASMPGGTDPGAGHLGNLTLKPGVYKSAGATFDITGGPLTLDAQGNANAVWVFQTAAGLTVGDTSPRSVLLINGALPKNVFWHVGSAATINGAGGGTMVGTIIAPAGVTFSTAGNTTLTVLNGRALGLTASVTMVNTVINVPAP
jgi:hypothetical protein